MKHKQSYLRVRDNETGAAFLDNYNYMTVAELVEELGLSNTTVIRLRQGKRVRLGIMKKVAAFMECDVRDVAEVAPDA